MDKKQQPQWPCVAVLWIKFLRNLFYVNAEWLSTLFESQDQKDSFDCIVYIVAIDL